MKQNLSNIYSASTKEPSGAIFTTIKPINDKFIRKQLRNCIDKTKRTVTDNKQRMQGAPNESDLFFYQGQG